jgi:arginase family enzyme
MAKLSQKELDHLKGLDRPAFEFANENIQRFFDRALEQGYSLDTTGFLAHPGFFQAPHRRDLTDVDIALVGSPLDLGAIGLSGARHGPKALREASRNYGPINDRTGEIPFDLCSIIDWGDIDWSETSLSMRLEDISGTFAELGANGCYTLNAGGEHTTSYGVLKGLSEAHNDSFGLVHIDAHCDTMSTWGGDAVNDGSVFRQAALAGYIDPRKTIQIGIRGRSDFLWEFSRDSGMTVISADEVFERGTSWVVDQIHSIVGPSAKTYFSFDVDALDASVMMGTTGPEPFGLSPRQVRNIIHGCYDLNFIGADIVEHNPSRDSDGASALVAAALQWELLSLLAHCKSVRSDTGMTCW